MCCSAACAFHPVVLSLNQNSSSAHPLLPRCRPIINHCCPIWHPRRGPQAVLSRFSTNPGWSHRPELHTNPGNDYSNRSNQGNLRNWHACRDRCRPQTRPSRQSSSAVPLPHSFSFNQHISSWQELAHKPTHQSSSHMTKRAMLVA